MLDARSVNRVLDVAAERHPGTVAVETDDDALTYGELHDAALRLAGGLAARGVHPRDRVAACLGNGADIVVAFYAVQRLGAIWLGINGQLAPPEQAQLLRETAPKLFLTTAAVRDTLTSVADPDHVGVLALDAEGAEQWGSLRAGPRYDGPAVDPFAPAAIAFTSGTSGIPKGVVHSQHNLVLPGEVLCVTRGYDERFRRGDSLPLTILNLIVLSTLTAVQAGGTSVLTNPKHADGLAAWIGEKRLTVVNLVPPILHSLIRSPTVDPRDLSSLREVATGGAPCPEAIREEFRQRFGLPVHSTYGLTEAPSIVTIDDLDRPGPPQTSGRALPHLNVRIDPSSSPSSSSPPDDASGEIVVTAARSGPWAGVWRPALGYWGKDDTRSGAGSDMLRTGDFGRLDDDGRLVVLERLSSVILRGGANVYPAEVERVLRGLDGVADAVVVGLPDDRLGQTVHAVVELEPGSTRPGDDLVEQCATQLARDKTPARIVIVDAIERNALGKPDRRWAVQCAASEQETA